MAGYTLEALKTNRVSVLAFGGSEADRRAIAEAAAEALGAGAVVVAPDAAAVERAASRARAVVYVPSVAALPAAAQRTLVRVLREREERPKFVLGLPGTPEAAREEGSLTDDLCYWLSTSTVDARGRARR